VPLPHLARMPNEFRFTTGDALLVVDVINDFKHDDGERLLQSFREKASAMAAAIATARASHVPVIYANDDGDRWNSDGPGYVRAVLESGADPNVLRELIPAAGDYFLLKHRYSAFDHTALDILLERLGVDRVCLIGSATEGCVVQTVIDARELGLKATIIADACATTDTALEKTALDYAEHVVGARIRREGDRGDAES
jgi:nicotinamidase-related amidase